MRAPRSDPPHLCRAKPGSGTQWTSPERAPLGGVMSGGASPPVPPRASRKASRGGRAGARARAVACGATPGRGQAGCGSAGPQTPLHALGRAQPPSPLSGPCRTTQGEPGALRPAQGAGRTRTAETHSFCEDTRAPGRQRKPASAPATRPTQRRAGWAACWPAAQGAASEEGTSEVKTKPQDPAAGARLTPGRPTGSRT